MASTQQIATTITSVPVANLPAKPAPVTSQGKTSADNKHILLS